MNTVDGIAKNFTKREVSRAQGARKLQNSLGFPSTRVFVNMIRGNVLKNCPITIEDVNNAEVLFGPNLGSLKGKTTRQASNVVTPFESTDLPLEIIDRCRDVTLCCDLMFVNKTIFLVTISRLIKFGTGEVLLNRHSTSILKGIEAVCKLYTGRGMRVRVTLMDGEFECLRTALSCEGYPFERGLEQRTRPRNRKVHSDSERTYTLHVQQRPIQTISTHDDR